MPLRKPPLKEPEINENSAETEIRALAAKHGITAERDGVDIYCEIVSSLAGDDIQLDEVEQLVVNIGRAKVMDGVKLSIMLGDYLRERRS